MNIFKNLFGKLHSRLEIFDSELGKFNSDYINKLNVMWIGSITLFHKSVNLFINGNQEGLSKVEKEYILNALSNEDNLKNEFSIALNEEYNNAELNFKSLEEHFELMSVSTSNEGFELSFEQKEEPYYYFNVYFINNKQTGVSIDS